MAAKRDAALKICLVILGGEFFQHFQASLLCNNEFLTPRGKGLSHACLTYCNGTNNLIKAVTVRYSYKVIQLSLTDLHSA